MLKLVLITFSNLARKRAAYAGADTAAEKRPGTAAHTRNLWFTALWQSWQNSNPHSHLQDKKHFHTSGFYDSSGLLPLPGANDFSCRPAVNFPSLNCSFLRCLKHVFPFWRTQWPISLFGSTMLVQGCVWELLAGARSVSKAAASAGCQKLLRIFLILDTKPEDEWGYEQALLTAFGALPPSSLAG